MKLILRCLWRGLGVGFRTHLGSKIGVLGRLGPSWRRLGASWKRLGQRLEASCRVCRVLERLGTRLGVVGPFSAEPKGFERQVRGNLPVAPAGGADGGLDSLISPSSPRSLLPTYRSLLPTDRHLSCQETDLSLANRQISLLPTDRSLSCQQTDLSLANGQISLLQRD